MESMGFPDGRVRNVLRLAMAATVLVVATTALAAESVKIYRSTMPDGSVVLGDKPASGAKTVASDTYVLTAPKGAAQAEREYWRREAEAFDRRQQREMEAPRRRTGLRHDPDGARSSAGLPSYAAAGDYAGYAGYDGYGAYGANGGPGGYGDRLESPGARLPRAYTSSPGAARGRSGGFIGSGFSTSR
jgi:hypothetical protein